MLGVRGCAPEGGEVSVVVAAWGGGVNSTAMICEWLARGNELHLALFADTGGEKPETYRYRDYFAAWLKDRGVPFNSVVGAGKYGSLEEECLGSKTLPSLAYGFKKCSLKWKRRPQDVFVNNWEPARASWAKGEKVVKLIGFDAGEQRRAKFPEDEKYTWRYPLIEYGLDRDGCVQSIKDHGLAVPPKSSCFFCPASKKNEIINLAQDHPDLMKRALQIEKSAEETNQFVVGLGRSFRWADVVSNDKAQGKLWNAEPEMPCDCTDGDE